MLISFRIAVQIMRHSYSIWNAKMRKAQIGQGRISAERNFQIGKETCLKWCGKEGEGSHNNER